MKKILTTTFLILLLLSSFVPQIVAAQAVSAGTPVTNTPQTPSGSAQASVENSSAAAGQKVVGTSPAVCFSLYQGSIDPEACITTIIKWISYYFLVVSAWVLGFAGLILNEVIVRTIIGMKAAFDNIEAINSGWKLIRDVGNSFFIFILLYVAVTTVLGLNNGNTKRIIRNIIIVGLLVNFSLFFTKVLIDASNITTIYFHTAIVEVKTPTDGALDVVTGFSGKFAKALGITSLFNPNPDEFARQAGGTATKMLIFGVGGSIFLMVTAFTFLLAAVLLLIRFVVLIILLILSPVAYFGYILPGTQQYAKKWWNLLASQLMFAPLLMIMMFLVLTLAQTLSIAGGTGNNGLSGALTLSAGTAKIVGEQTAAAANSPTLAGSVQATGALSVLFNFVVIIGFMIFAIIISTTVASNTGGFVGSIVNRTRSNMIGASKWLGRKGYGGAKAATLGAANVAATNVMSSRLGRSVQDVGLKAQNRVLATKQAFTLQGRNSYKKLQGEHGDMLRERVKAGDVWAQKKLDRLEATSKGYRARLTKQKENTDKLINRKGTASSSTQANIKVAKLEVEKAEESRRVAMAMSTATPEERTARDAAIKAAEREMKSTKENFGRHQRSATREIGEQRIQYAAAMGGKLSQGAKNGSKEYIDKVKNAKKSNEEKIAEFQDKLTDTLATGDRNDIKKILYDMTPNQVKDLPSRLLKDPKIAYHLTVEDVQAIQKAGNLTPSDRKDIGKILREVAEEGKSPSGPHEENAVKLSDYFRTNRDANNYW